MVRNYDSSGKGMQSNIGDAMLKVKNGNDIVKKLLQKHHGIVFDKSTCKIQNKVNGTMTVVQMKRSMFDLKQVDVAEACDRPMQTDDHDNAAVADSHEGLGEMELWHRRLCH